MDKIVLNDNDVMYLFDWCHTHPDEIYSLQNIPLKAIKIICQDAGIILTCILENENICMRVTQQGSSVGFLEFTPIMDGTRYRLIKDTAKDLSTEGKNSVLSLYCSVMALLLFGNERKENTQEEAQLVSRISKTVKVQKKSEKPKKKGFTYILKRSGNGNPKIAVKGSHNSPQGKFFVRGHYRRYKNGNVIWVNEYVKGDGKKSSKLYKIQSNK